MIGLYEVSEFVDDHVIYDEHRSLDQAPVEIYIVIHRTGAPTVAIVNDPGRSKLHIKLTSVLFHAGENLFLGSRHIPISEHFTTLGLMRGGHDEAAGEFNLSTCCP